MKFLLFFFFVFQNLGVWTAYTLRVRQRGPNEMRVSICQSASRHVLEHLNLHQQGCDKLIDPTCSLHLKVRSQRNRPYASVSDLCLLWKGVRTLLCKTASSPSNRRRADAADQSRSRRAADIRVLETDLPGGQYGTAENSLKN
jgi:hypothetical protein